MTIKEKKVYEIELKNKDIEALSDTIGILYQLKNNPEVLESVKENSVNEGVKNISVTDMILTLQEIGGEDYQKYIRKVKL